MEIAGIERQQFWFIRKIMNISETENQILQRVLEYKRHIHTHPESGWQEVATTKYILEQLDTLSLIQGLGENNTGAAFKVGQGQVNIFVRADIDALKTSDGPQHLCGHSTHTAALMGAYHWLKDHESQLTAAGKQVTFIFQPAEEIHPSGARTFLETYTEIFSGSQYGFAIHVEPHLPTGSVQIQKGPIWAAHDSVKVEIRGKAAHVKNTPQGIDAIDGATQVVQLFRSLQNEFSNFGEEIVFNFNTIQGGTANNTVADKALLTGAVRWLNRSDQERVRRFFTGLPQMLERTFPGSVNISYVSEAVPVCINEPQLAGEIADYMDTHSGFNVSRNGAVDLGVEDFAHYARQYNTLYSKVGIDCPYDLHDPQMIVSDEATLQVYHYWKNLLQWWIEK